VHCTDEKDKKRKVNLDITKPVAWATIAAEMGKETVNIDQQVEQEPAQLALPVVVRRDEVKELRKGLDAMKREKEEREREVKELRKELNVWKMEKAALGERADRGTEVQLSQCIKMVQMAMVIQSAWRMSNAQNRFWCKIDTIVMVQMLYHKNAARKYVEQRRREQQHEQQMKGSTDSEQDQATALKTPTRVTQPVTASLGGSLKQVDATPKQKDDSDRTLDPTQIPKRKDNNVDYSLVDTPENAASVMPSKMRASAGAKKLRQGGKGRPMRKTNEEIVFANREPRRELDLSGQDISPGKNYSGGMGDSVVWTKEELKEEEYGITRWRLKQHGVQKAHVKNMHLVMSEDYPALSDVMNFLITGETNAEELADTISGVPTRKGNELLSSLEDKMGDLVGPPEPFPDECECIHLGEDQATFQVRRLDRDQKDCITRR
jgi:hypothetical protein